MLIKTFSAKLIINFTTLLTNLIEGLLGARVLLKMFGASTAAPFVRWIYDNTTVILSPFTGMFPNEPIGGNLIIEFSALFALLFYAYIGYLLTELLITINDYSRRRQQT